MYIDGLTITALVVFAVALGVFVKRCIVDNCLDNSKQANCRQTGRGA